MRIIIAACLAGIGLGGAASLVEPEANGNGAIDHVVTGTTEPAERLAFYVNGRAAECELKRLDDSAMRTVGPGCRSLPHRLADVTDWIEVDDGAVALARADGSVSVRLAISDGAAYESFDPPSPMVLLAAD
jgi:hypothetical protein